MANVFYQTSMQLVFAVKNREALIRNSFQDLLHRYIGGILVNSRHKPLAINSVEDHIHIFFGMRPCDIPSLVRDLKSEASAYINKNRLSPFPFAWQEGYGLFSYTLSDRDRVIKYIENQKTHHMKQTFREEYIRLLKKSEVEYEDQYLFDFWD